jgi:SAM-dependent methyltransferase
LQLPRPVKRFYQRLRYGADGKAAKHARKSRARRERFDDAERWQHGDLPRRRYGSYDDYLEHQSSKLDKIQDRRAEKDERVAIPEFVRRFRGCSALEGAGAVLCLGARLGAEVRALHELGYFAVGIDLNPGPANPYVLHGDFHRLVFPDGSVDVVYTNALDHVWNLEDVIREVRRVLRPGGAFVADILPGFDEGFTPGEYESTHWRTIDYLVERICAAASLVEESRVDLGETGRDRWFQIVLRNRA